MAGLSASLSTPYEGLAGAWVVLFTIGFVVTCAMFAWTVTLFVRARRAISHPPEAPAGGADAFEWVFIVPALNEELTIRDCVSRLTAIPVAHRDLVVVDDGSTDRTAEILAELPEPTLHVIHRKPPEARKGKAAALDDVYRRLDRVLGARPDRDRVIIAVVDADGRLAPDAPRFAAAQFEDPRVGGVQSRVRIYNRQHWLTWFQDVEFAVYGRLFQLGRNSLGTAGMGGNGQFNRLSALDAVTDQSGPWRDRLTEDLDLGLRLIAAGWLCRHDDRSVVEQQGVPNLGRLLRQRTRWAQGNLQAFELIPRVRHAPISLTARVELLIYLLMPVWQMLAGVCLMAAIVLAATDAADFWSGGPLWQTVFFGVLGFSGVVLGCVARGTPRGGHSATAGALLAIPYAVYSWLIWPVLLRAIARQVTAQRSWAKTEREPVPVAPP